MVKSEKFDSWAVVELFGHNQIAGRVSEQMIAGKLMVRVDVPKASGNPGFTKFYSPDAVYAITPTTKRLTMSFTENLHPEPIQVYMLRPSFPEPIRTPEQILAEEEDDYQRRLKDEEAEVPF
jgi:hypothetical protein